MRPAVFMSFITTATGADALGTDHSTCYQGWQLVFATLGENTSQNWEGIISSWQHKLQSLQWASSAIAFDIFSDDHKQKRKKKMAGDTERPMGLRLVHT